MCLILMGERSAREMAVRRGEIERECELTTQKILIPSAGAAVILSQDHVWGIPWPTECVFDAHGEMTASRSTMSEVNWGLVGWSIVHRMERHARAVVERSVLVVNAGDGGMIRNRLASAGDLTRDSMRLCKPNGKDSPTNADDHW